MPSMIQSYMNFIQNRNSAPAERIPQSQDSLRTGVKAYKPKGYIIKKQPFSLQNIAKDDAEAIKYFFKGIQGKGNDYSIGRINDTAIKLSGLGIAGMIAASNGSPLKKGMEFVGLLCWLGAMHFWPKLAVNTPLKYLKGVDLDAEYITSHGHKKRFYGDPQFICWDMISDEEISKIGDKLNIPRNIQNRRKAVENKARQIAVQGNTLALLTAGIATPVVASLAADKLGKYVINPALTKLYETRAEGMKSVMTNRINNLLKNDALEKYIDKELPQTISPATRQGLYTMFDKLTDDKILAGEIKQTIDNILDGKNAKETTIAIDNALNKKITSVFEKYAPKAKGIPEKITEFASAYPEKLDSRTANLFVSKLVKTMQREEIISAQQALDISGELKETFNALKTVTLDAPDLAAEKLKNLSRIVITYQEKVNELFNKRFYNYVWNGAVSTNANIWDRAPEQMLKALNIKGNVLKQLANAPSENVAYNILSKHIDNLIKHPEQFNDAIAQLGKIASEQSVRNEQNLKFSLDYIDRMQSLLTSYDKKNEFAALTSKLSSLFAHQRKTLLGKYASTNNALYTPIRILDVLKRISDPQEYEIVKKVLVEGQTVDAFINRLDHLKDYIKNEGMYKNVVEKVFGNISADVKQRLPKNLAEKIDDMSVLMKYLFTTQSDGVNVKYSMKDANAIVNILKKLNLYKYADELWDLSFTENARNNIFEKIKSIVSSNPNKVSELQTFLRLIPEEAIDLRLWKFEALSANFFGNAQIGPGFIEKGRNRLKTLLNFMETSDLSSLGDFVIDKARSGKTSAMQAPTFKNLIKDSSQKVLSYNTWFKRVGLAFVGLCAVTALAVSQIGKRNEFNPDIYKGRRA